MCFLGVLGSSNRRGLEKQVCRLLSYDCDMEFCAKENQQNRSKGRFIGVCLPKLLNMGELLKRRVVLQADGLLPRFEQVASCSRSELLYTKQRVAYQRFAYQRFEQVLVTKDDRESQLYDEFEHFRQNKGETIQGYYVRFTKLINDMRNIKMTMPRMQLNSKFVNNMLPEWSRFITEVKLNRGHSNPNNDPLALVSDASVQQYPTQSSKSPQPSKEPSPADNFQLDSGSSSIENLIESLSNTLALLTQSLWIKTGNVLVQDVPVEDNNATNQGRPFQRNNARGNGVAGNVGGHNRGGMINLGQAKPIKCYNCNGLGHIARECPKAREHVTNFDDDVDNSLENDLALNVDHVFEADECDAFDSDVDEGPTLQTKRYASKAGFGVRLSCQKRLKCGYVKTKYLVCNREGCPKEVWLNTLDPKKNDRQVRASNFRVYGCKARVQFDMVPKTSKYRLVVFDLEHNHELDRIEYKHLSKAERKLTYNEQLYKMVFLPFTAIDYHRRSVTVGSGLLKSEAAESYAVLLLLLNLSGLSLGFAIVAYHAKDPAMFIGPEEFKDKWNKLMEEFNLVNHKWLSKMYRLRSSWIPAFFVDSPLCGLMRTTSRSESENSFLSYFLSFGATLVKFMLCYESTMERQRQTQEKLDHRSFDSFPNLLTPLPIEDHASKVYTRSLFIRVQKEIVAGSWLCSITIIEKLSMEASIILDSCVHMLRNNEPKLSVFVSQMKEIKSKLEAELPIVPNRIVSDFVEEFMGVKKPNQVKVRNPTGVKPKGREKGKRIKSGREISMKKSNKKKSGCGICGSTSHNRRTCPGKDNHDALYPAVLVSGSNDHADGGSRDGSFGSGSV
ncbi:FAR1-related sequence 5-like protein [Tanacetum coccineum]|uniref:FAR1-related sequence 5-like protein n=1 Tax=Tanacetum coccineum TaxID=301880 RepID=A0ABQ5DQ31_9ASTR